MILCYDSFRFNWPVRMHETFHYMLVVLLLNMGLFVVCVLSFINFYYLWFLMVLVILHLTCVNYVCLLSLRQMSSDIRNMPSLLCNNFS